MTLGIAGNPAKDGINALIETIIRRCTSEGIPFILHKQLIDGIGKRFNRALLRGVNIVSDKDLCVRSSIILSLGGDGTILQTARMVGKYGTPILGVNLGKLGFLAETSVDDLEDCLEDLKKGRYQTEERLMLESWLEGTTRKCLALNEIVIDLSVSSRMFSVETYVNEDFLSTFTGDGVIVSTPTGSTGYALSNGGPIIAPTARAMMVSPICPHTLTARPVVIPDDSRVTLTVKTAPARVQIAADGQQQHLLKAPVRVFVQKAPFAAKLVKRQTGTYYDVLRRKLHWGKDVRTPD
jgi:NAD+ kinase